MELLTFLRQENRLDMQLNADSTVQTALLSVPSTALVKVVYCTGIGASGLGSTSPINGKFLVLTGEGGKELGTPSVLVLHESLLEERTVVTMSEV